MTAAVVLSKAFLLTAVLVAGVAYYVWVPLPEDVDQRGLVRVMSVLVRFKPAMWLLVSVILGHKTELETTRWIVNDKKPFELDSDPLLQVTNDVFNGIPVRVYRPKSAPVPSPVVMFFHGGGWVFGSVDHEDAMARYLAKHSNASVVSVEYRLAPEHPFPAALDDCVAATVHVLENGQQLGFDTSRIGVSGTSAGGNLAAAVSLRLLDADFQNRGLPKLKYQTLLLPCLQGLDFTLPAYADDNIVSKYILPREMMVSFYQYYAGLGDSPTTTEQMIKGQHIREKTRSELAKYVHRNLITGSKTEVVDLEMGGTVNETLASLAEPVLLNYRLSPLLAPDDLLKRVPPAFVMFTHNDVLRDDAVLYIRRLRQAGTEVMSYFIENGHHFSFIIGSTEPGSKAAAEGFEKMTQFIKDRNKS